MKKYVNNLGILGGVAVGIMAVSLFGILGTASKEVVAIEVPVDVPIKIEATVNEKEEIDEVAEVEAYVPEAINGLLIGFDKTGGLTDVIMVGHVDPATNKVQIISIPRDLEVYFTDEAFKEIKANNPNNQVLHCKINSIYSLIGWDERALQDVKAVVEVITGLEMDYMTTIDISGFGEMVDTVGGVEFDVPQDMKYSDPIQDLKIDLKKGVQILDGDKAEQLVRYRKGYERGDLQRIEVQQEFAAAFLDKVTNVRDFNLISQLLTTGYGLIETDFGLVVMLEYAEFFFDLDLEHILSGDNMITIPSYGEKIEGMWFQFFDLEEANKAVEELLSNDDK